MNSLNKIISLLEDYIEEDDQDALDQALDLVAGTRVNITSLLKQLEDFKGDLPRKRRVINLVRMRLGLSIIPGPVCKRNP